MERETITKRRLSDEVVDRLEGLKVLAVDDNATNRLILDEMLKSWGMAPTVVERRPPVGARGAVLAAENGPGRNQ